MTDFSTEFMLQQWIHGEFKFEQAVIIRDGLRNQMHPWLRRRRKKADVSIRELARRSGISYGYLSNMERGLKGYLPTLRVLRAYKNHLE